MKCQRCEARLIVIGQKYCHVCGWNLANELSVRKTPMLESLTVCPGCGGDLPQEAKKRNLVCPHCGQYLAASLNTLDPMLIQTAVLWTKKTREFCLEVLRLGRRASNALHRAQLSPLEVLALQEDQVGEIRNFRTVGYAQLKAARGNWVEEKK